MKKLLTIIISASLVCTACNKQEETDKSNSKSTGDTGSSKDDKKNTAQEVKIEELFKEFKKNSIAAKTKYDNAYLLLLGRVDGFDTKGDKYEITIRDEEQMRIFANKLIVTFNKNLVSNELAKQLNDYSTNIQYISFTAFFSNYSYGDITLVGAELIKVETQKERFDKNVSKMDKDKALEVSLKTLKNDESDKYYNKYLKVSGYVDYIYGEGAEPYIIISDKSPGEIKELKDLGKSNSVSCAFDANDNNINQLAKLTPYDYDNNKNGSFVIVIGILKSNLIQPSLVKSEILKIK